jgi:hypothetical protein
MAALAVRGAAAREGKQLMKLTAVVISTALVLGLLAGVGWAYPTRFGPTTGLVDLPTPDTVEAGTAQFAIDYAKIEGGLRVWPARVVVGVSKNAELGVGYAKLKDGVSDQITSFAGKVTLLSEPQADFGLGVGASILDTTGGDVTNVYAVASKEFPLPASERARYEARRVRIRGHLGLMYTQVSNGVSDNEIKPYLGADLTTPEGSAFVAEYKWTKFGKDDAAAAIRYPVSPKVTVQAGVARAGTILGQTDYRFIIGLSYDLSTGGGTQY